MTAPELKPCPFCGGASENWRAHEGRTAWISCMGRCAVLVSKEYKTDAEAIAAWNTRADLPPTLADALALPEIAALVEALDAIAEPGFVQDKDAPMFALEWGDIARTALAAVRGKA